MKTIRKALLASRAPFSTASLLGAIVAVSWAQWRYETFSIVDSILALFGVLFVHLAANTANDYFDWDNTDKVNLFPGPFSGGSRKKFEQLFPGTDRKYFLMLTQLFGLLAIVCGLMLVLRGKSGIVPLAAVGGLLALAYSAPPLRLSEKGLGEFTIFVTFGPLLSLGTAYACTGQWLPEAIFIGVPNGFLVTQILWINELPDVPADRLAGKKTLVVRLGTARARWGVILLSAVACFSVVAGVLFNLFSLTALVALVPILLVVRAVKTIWVEHANPPKLLPAQRTAIQVQAASTFLLAMALLVN